MGSCKAQSSRMNEKKKTMLYHIDYRLFLNYIFDLQYKCLRILMTLPSDVTLVFKIASIYSQCNIVTSSCFPIIFSILWMSTLSFQ